MVNRVKTIVINLDSDVERLISIKDALRRESILEVARLGAIPGRSIPIIARSLLAGAAEWIYNPGELGCFLSHVKAWEAVVAENDRNTWYLILEDDVKPVNLNRLVVAQIPPDLEFCFVNNRVAMNPSWDSAGESLTFIPISRSLPVLNERSEGAGADGYVTCYQGAYKLLDAVRSDLYYGHVDGRLLRYSLSRSDVYPDYSNTFIGDMLLDHHNKNRDPGWKVVTAYFTNIPLIFHGDSPSSREAMNKRPR